jgi:DNA-binding response OmpR family regulator
MMREVCPAPQVLIVEDERKVLRSLERGLQAEGYEPDYALTNVIDVYINALGRRLEQPGSSPLIHTHAQPAL